jgi:hypothetical protein
MRVKQIKFESEDWINLEQCAVQCRAVVYTGRHEMWDVVLPQTLFGIVKYGTLKMSAYVQTEICNLGFQRERGSKGKKNKYKEGQISKEVETVL